MKPQLDCKVFLSCGNNLWSCGPGAVCQPGFPGGSLPCPVPSNPGRLSLPSLLLSPTTFFSVQLPNLLSQNFVGSSTPCFSRYTLFTERMFFNVMRILVPPSGDGRLFSCPDCSHRPVCQFDFVTNSKNTALKGEFSN